MKFDDTQIGGVETGAVRVRYPNGNEIEGREYIRQGRALLGELKQRMQQGAIGSAMVNKTLLNGVKLHARSIMLGLAHTDEIWIAVPPKPESKEKPLHCVGFYIHLKQVDIYTAYGTLAVKGPGYAENTYLGLNDGYSYNQIQTSECEAGAIPNTLDYSGGPTLGYWAGNLDGLWLVMFGTERITQDVESFSAEGYVPHVINRDITYAHSFNPVIRNKYNHIRIDGNPVLSENSKRNVTFDAFHSENGFIAVVPGAVSYHYFDQQWLDATTLHSITIKEFYEGYTLVGTMGDTSGSTPPPPDMSVWTIAGGEATARYELISTTGPDPLGRYSSSWRVFTGSWALRFINDNGVITYYDIEGNPTATDWYTTYYPLGNLRDETTTGDIAYNDFTATSTVKEGDYIVQGYNGIADFSLLLSDGSFYFPSYTFDASNSREIVISVGKPIQESPTEIFKKRDFTRSNYDPTYAL